MPLVRHGLLKYGPTSQLLSARSGSVSKHIILRLKTLVRVNHWLNHGALQLIQTPSTVYLTEHLLTFSADFDVSPNTTFCVGGESVRAIRDALLQYLEGIALNRGEY
jgi:hypothetical protein